MAVPQPVTLSRLHLTIFTHLAGAAEVNVNDLYTRVEAELWAAFGDSTTVTDLRLACLELEHLGFIKVDAATADWSLTDAGQKMYAMAKAKARKPPDFVDKTKH